MSRKPSIGLILLRAEWFTQVVALPELAEGMRADAEEIHSQLSKDLSVDHTWVVSSTNELQLSIGEILITQVDLFLLVFQVWAEDVYLMPLVHAIGGRPLAVWCYLPWQKPPRPLPFSDVLRASGPVGTLEGLGTLRNLKVDYLFTSGAPGDLHTRRDLFSFARAGQAWRTLRQARFGLLPARNEQMQSTFVDEFRLLAEIGPSILSLSVADLKNSADCLPENEVEAFLTELRSEFKIIGVDDKTLAQAARCSLALAKLAIERQLDLISINDIVLEMHTAFGLRPCLYPGTLREAGILAGLEGDLGAAVALLVQNAFSHSPLFFLEFWYWDQAENILVGGHAGLQDPTVANPGTAWIGPDMEYAQSDPCPGAHLQFVARPGPVTLLQVRGTPSGWQAIVAGGYAIETEPWLEGYPHAVIRLNVPVDKFLSQVARVGSTQHWIMAYGDSTPEIRLLCTLLKIPLEEISTG